MDVLGMVLGRYGCGRTTGDVDVDVLIKDVIIITPSRYLHPNIICCWYCIIAIPGCIGASIEVMPGSCKDAL
jgi:hypothetical protein